MDPPDKLVAVGPSGRTMVDALLRSDRFHEELRSISGETGDPLEVIILETATDKNDLTEYAFKNGLGESARARVDQVDVTVLSPSEWNDVPVDGDDDWRESRKAGKNIAWQSLPETGGARSVTILVDFGDGIESGAAVELARTLGSNVSTGIVGLLPVSSEPEESRANAFATLAELEYLSLVEENQIDDIGVLRPNDTGTDDGSEGRELPPGTEFASLFTPPESGSGDDPETRSTDVWGPFTLVDSTTLDGEREDGSTAGCEGARPSNADPKRRQHEVEAEQQILERVADLLDAIDTDLFERFPDDTGVDVEDRLESIRALIAASAGPDRLPTDLDDRVEAAVRGDRDVSELIESFTSSMPPVGNDRQNDPQLQTLVAEELRSTIRREKLRLRAARVDEETVRETVDYLLSPATETQTFPSMLKSLHQRLATLESDRRLLDDLEDVQRFRDEPVDPDMEALVEALAAYCEAVSAAATVAELTAVDRGPVDESLGAVASKLDALGVEFESCRSRIETSLETLDRVREAAIRAERDLSTVETVVPWESTTERQRKEAKRDFRIQHSKLQEAGVFNVDRDPTFTVEVKFDGEQLLQRAEERRSELRSTVETEIEARIDGTGADLPASASALDVVAIGRRYFGHEGTATSTDPDLDEARVTIERKIDAVEAAADCLQDLKGPREQVANSDVGPAEGTVGRNGDHTETGRTTVEGSSAEVARNFLTNRSNLAAVASFESVPRSVDCTIVRPEATPLVDDSAEIARAVRQVVGNSDRMSIAIQSRECSPGQQPRLVVCLGGLPLDAVLGLPAATGYDRAYRRRAEALDDAADTLHTVGLEEGYFVRRRERIDPEFDPEFFARPSREITAALQDSYIQKVPIGDEHDTSQPRH